MKDKKKKIDQAVKEIVEKVRVKFPEVQFEGAESWVDADVAIRLRTPSDNGWEISRFTAPLQVKLFEEEGLDIVVLPLEQPDDTDGQKVE
jgi:hypothetical protein